MAKLTGSRPAGIVTVDVDPVDLHLVGYGHTGSPPDERIYERAIPRLLEVFQRRGVRATFFIVGRDVQRQAAVLATIRDAGHELACHSLTHPMPFARLPRDQLRFEVSEPRRLLKDHLGVDAQGFRAPNWDLSRSVLEALVSAGYAYDASALPTPLQVAVRVLLAFKARGANPLLRANPWPFTLRRLPHQLHLGAGALWEYPVAVTPRLRWPVYHTARYRMAASTFGGHLDGFVRRGDSLVYALHAVDMLGLAEDDVDRRLATHPGMSVPLAEKEQLMEAVLTDITARFAVRPLGEDVVARQRLS